MTKSSRSLSNFANFSPLLCRKAPVASVPYEAGLRQNFVHILTRHGWQLVRVNGSHHILTKSGHRERLVIPVHGNQPLKLGLLKNQMKIAGLTEADL